MKADTQKQYKHRFKTEKSSNSPLRNFINGSTSPSGNVTQQQSDVKPTVPSSIKCERYTSLTRNLQLQKSFRSWTLWKVLKYWKPVKKPNGFSSSSKIFQECITQKGLLTIECLFRILSKVKIFSQPVKNMALVYFIIKLSTAYFCSTYVQFIKNILML